MSMQLQIWKAPLALLVLAGLARPTIADMMCSSEPMTEACFHMLKLKPWVLGVPPREFYDHPIKAATEAATEFWEIFGPGGKLHPAYFLAHKGHLVIEGLLVTVIAYLFLQHTFKPRSRSEEPLTEKEVDQLCKEWKPEPLTPTLQAEDRVPARIISSYQGKHVVADGKLALDAATFNFLGLSGTDSQKIVARDTIAKYGVGSCGPRGFYGTIDVHLKLEDDLSKFMGSPQAIVYSSDTATITSIIPAFANRKDVLVLDECCAYPVQQGATVSRATVYWFKHNDMEDLERILKHVEKEAAKEKKPLNRRLIVVEGIYANTGELAPLDQLVRLKDKYKYRLVVEESFSFGVLGATGRGAVEHWGLAPEQVEIVCASMGNALGSVGGFCVGSDETVEHQRLSGSGYCFSASLPPYLATAASESVSQLQRQAGALLPKLHANSAALRAELRKLSAYQVVGSGKGNDVSPLIHLHLVNQPADRHKATQLLAKIADHALQTHGVLVGLALYSDLDRIHPPPGLQLAVNVALTPADIQTIITALSKAAKEVL